MSIIQFLADLDAEVQAGWVDEKVKGDLSLFNYSQLCQMAGHWNKTTRQCRGLIVDRKNLCIVARPFKKFFNLNENDWSTYDKFPVWNDSEPVEVTEKMDGSLGIITKYKGELLVTTRGSFDSDQAIWAKEFIEKNWDVDAISENHTLLGEIIYPENRVVVDYKGLKSVVLLAVIHTNSGIELNRDGMLAHAQAVGAEQVKTVECKGFDHLIQQKEILDFNTEGWVVHFPRTNQRVKIKTDDYCRLHRIISNLSPLAMWESMKGGRVDSSYLLQIPEEFKTDVQWMQDALEEQYLHYKHLIDQAMLHVKTETGIHNPKTREDFKTLALHIKVLKDKVVQKGCFVLMRNNSLEDTIMTAIRPDSNIVRNIAGTTTDTEVMT